jgi:hypothetical protein
MGSWVECPCGNSVHKNLFAGASVNILVCDDDLDQVDDSWDTGKMMVHLVTKGNVLVRCKKCGRIMIESRDTGEISVYGLEEAK